LVEAVNTLRAPQNLTSTEKQAHIDRFLANRGGKLTAEDIQECYQTIVNPGFVGKARHALMVCFGSGANDLFDRCFRIRDRKNRLYDIRNAVNHGEIDAENPMELVRVESRLVDLWKIVWGIFGRLVPFSAPLVSSSPREGS
jgi:hypothetical protein